MGLGSGGAENMLLKLTKEHLKDKSIRQIVLIFSKNEFLLPKFLESNIEVKNLALKSPLLIFFNLISELYRFKPDALQCWMYHAEFLGTISKLFYWRKMKLFWNIRCSELDWSKRSVLNKIIFKFLTKFSYLPNAIFCNTSNGIDNHILAGYKPSKLKLIYNGFSAFSESYIDESKGRLFNRLNIPLNFKNIVMVARLNYVKDHKTLIEAFNLLLEDENFKDTNLILIGDNSNNTIKDEIISSKNIKNIYMLGNIDNVSNITRYCDIGVLTSLHEGFPNVIGEYILANLMVVSTNVGEVKTIIAQEEPFLTNKKDCKSLAKYFKIALSLSNEERNIIATKNKEKVINEFLIEKIASKYLQLYKVS
jgi:glycosyltransferase involved in cell wall biosynthesis